MNSETLPPAGVYRLRAWTRFAVPPTRNVAFLKDGTIAKFSERFLFAEVARFSSWSACTAYGRGPYRLWACAAFGRGLSRLRACTAYGRGPQVALPLTKNVALSNGGTIAKFSARASFARVVKHVVKHI